MLLFDIFRDVDVSVDYIKSARQDASKRAKLKQVFSAELRRQPRLYTHTANVRNYPLKPNVLVLYKSLIPHALLE
jgi:hypothetical protein